MTALQSIHYLWPWFGNFGAEYLDKIWFLVIMVALVIKETQDATSGSARHRLSQLYEIGRYIIGGGALLMVVYSIKYALLIPRPSAVMIDPFYLNLGLLNEYASFPSSHAALYMFLSCIMFHEFQSKPARALVIVLLFWVSLARVMVGYHYPIDIFVGWLLGLIAWWLVYRK